MSEHYFNLEQIQSSSRQNQWTPLSLPRPQLTICEHPTALEIASITHPKKSPVCIPFSPTSLSAFKKGKELWLKVSLGSAIKRFKLVFKTDNECADCVSILSRLGIAVKSAPSIPQTASQSVLFQTQSQSFPVSQPLLNVSSQSTMSSSMMKNVGTESQLTILGMSPVKQLPSTSVEAQESQSQAIVLSGKTIIETSHSRSFDLSQGQNGTSSSLCDSASVARMGQFQQSQPREFMTVALDMGRSISDRPQLDLTSCDSDLAVPTQSQVQPTILFTERDPAPLQNPHITQPRVPNTITFPDQSLLNQTDLATILPIPSRLVDLASLSDQELLDLVHETENDPAYTWLETVIRGDTRLIDVFAGLLEG